MHALEPNSFIPLHSPMGQTLLERAGFVNQAIIDNEMKQVNTKYCGLASLAFVINALHAINHVTLKQKKKKLDEEDILHSTENDVDKLFAKWKPSINGLTMENLHLVSLLFGFGVTSHYAMSPIIRQHKFLNSEKLARKIKQPDVKKFETIAQFREYVKQHIKRPVTALIVNYKMSKIADAFKWGHFSPLAAYNEKHDAFLIMDVWPTNPAMWVKSALLYKAMSTLDEDSGLPRGLLKINVLVN